MPQLYFTELAALGGSAMVSPSGLPAFSAAAIAAAEKAGLSEGLPFILDDDGSYDIELNRFFRACPTMGVRSPNSLRAYGRDLVVWMRFLRERRDSKAVWQADRDDVAAYHAARRRSVPVHRISAASWNRGVAALEKFYAWALEEELITASPFGSGMGWRRIHRSRLVLVKTMRAREPGARRCDLRFVSLDHFLLFRDVGLRGRDPDGCEDSAWSGRHGERNALFAELLVTTGLRLEEAASLLATEMPTLDRVPAKQRSLSFRLPAAITKGGRAREIRLPVRLLRRLADYIAIERANALGKRRSVVRRPIIGVEATRATIGATHHAGRRADGAVAQ
jgi:site-specific recombinase XerD